MATIVDVPLEIIEAIVQDESVPVSRNDLANLRLVCKHLDALLAHKVLSTVYINFEDWREARRLVPMASGPNRVHLLARTLKIRCLAPSANPSRNPPPAVMAANGKFTYHRNKQSSKEVIEATEIVSRYLPQAFQYFRNLEVVEWWTHGFDPPNINKTVMELLFLQTNLRAVSINMSSDVVYPLPQLNRLSGLTCLSIIFPRVHIQSGPMVLGLARAIQNCPDLLSFNFKIPYSISWHLGDLFKLDHVYSQLASSHHITELSLHIPTALGLTQCSILDNLTQLTSLNLRTGHTEEGYEELWARLKEQNIHLRIISFNIVFMVWGFTEYLMSYSGVEELRLSNEEMFRVGFNNTPLAMAFFDAITAKHSSTLRVLLLNLSPQQLSPVRVWGSADINRPQLLIQLPALSRLEIELNDNEKATIVSSTSGEYERLYKLLELLGP